MARILIVDDEGVVREMLSDLLTEAGHQVEEAVDGADALHRLRPHALDLLITDILMPGVGGLNVIKEAGQRAPGTPVIAISGGGKDGKLNFLSTAATFPNVRTLKKPFHVQTLLALVDELIGTGST